MLWPRTQWWVQLHVSLMKSNYRHKSGGVALIKTLPTCWHSFVRRQLEQKKNVGHPGHAGKKTWNPKNEERAKRKEKKNLSWADRVSSSTGPQATCLLSYPLDVFFPLKSSEEFPRDVRATHGSFWPMLVSKRHQNSCLTFPWSISPNQVRKQSLLIRSTLIKAKSYIL